MKMKLTTKYILASVALGAITSPAAAKVGGPVEISEGVTLDPIFNARVRYEGVDQDNALQDADAVTIRTRAGIELATSGFSVLAEAEATLAVVEDFNSTTNGNGGIFSVVADPENIELNRLQLKYANKDFGQVTVGRQRINLDDQRFVGAVGWRQNEQTFDAVSAKVTALKPVTLEGAYSNSQRTIFGVDAGPRTAFDGDFVFLGAGAKLGPVKVKAFSYLIDYDVTEPVVGNSNQTYGAAIWGKFKLGDKASVAVRARYARQQDFGSNPNNFSNDYIDGWAALTFSGITAAVGYENLGSDSGVGFRTPLATLHKFNGFADIFLNTPGAGLEDKYVKLAGKIPILGGAKASVTYHNFDSDVGGISYGSEIDATFGFKIKPFNILFKYANYNADTFAVDTEKFWFQIAYGF